MKKPSPKIYVLTQNILGYADILIPVFDACPKDIRSLSGWQNIKTGFSDISAIILSGYGKDGRRIEQNLDITGAYIKNATVKLCVVKSHNQCELIVYCNEESNGKFLIPSTFAEAIGLFP